MVVGVDTGLAALYRSAPASIRAGKICGVDPNAGASAQRGAVRCVSGGTGANCEDLVGARPVERGVGLEDLVRACVRALADDGSRIVHPHPAVNSEFGNRAQCVGEGRLAALP